MLIVWIFALIIVLLLSKVFFGSLVTPITLFFLPQLLQLILHGSGLFMVDQLSIELAIHIYVTWFSFVAGYFLYLLSLTIGSSKSVLKYTHLKYMSAPNNNCTFDNYRLLMIFAVGISLISFAGDAILALLERESILVSSSVDKARELRREYLAQSGERFSSIGGMLSITLYFVRSATWLALPLLGYLAAYRLSRVVKLRPYTISKSNVMVLLAVASVLVTLLFFSYAYASRGRLIRPLSLIFLGYLMYSNSSTHGYARNKTGRTTISKYVFGLVAALSVFTVFYFAEIFLEKSRFVSDNGPSFTATIYGAVWYFVGPLAALNSVFHEISWSGLFGERFFSGFWKMAEKFFEFEFEATMTYDFVYVPYVANTYTWIFEIVNDFGFIGIYILPIFIGFLSALGWHRFHKNHMYFWLVLSVWCSSVSVWSFYAFAYYDGLAISVALLTAFLLDRNWRKQSR